jgi:hemolysin D
MNGNHLNGNSQNGKSHAGNGNGTKVDSRVLTDERKALKPGSMDSKSLNFEQFQQFEQSVVLRQSPVWSRAIMITLMGLACFGIIWASVAKIEQVVPAAGQLKPEGTVKEVQAPVSGVVKTVYIKDGQNVKPGDLLLTFDSGANKAELESLIKIRNSLTQENKIYRGLMNVASSTAIDVALVRGKLPQEVAFLLKNRANLLGENQLLRTELKNSAQPNPGLGLDEQARIQVAKRELDSRAAAALLDVEQIKTQLAQNAVKINDTKANLALEQQILGRLKSLAEVGAIAQIQYLKQQQQVQTLTAEIAQLSEEQQRLQFDIEQGRQQVQNTVAVSNKSVLEKIGENKQRLAEIDSQLMKILLENEKRLAEVNSKISQTQLNVKYQELRAPVGGTVFDLQAKNTGFVANPTQKLLQIVPNENFIAEAFITNKDIGFVREGMKVDVRIDSFPYSEFGDIKGELISIGSDALPPDETHQFYRFPARIRLNQQSLDIKGKKISLQSGMSISANIKVREERSVISLFTELFTKQVESLKEVR